MAEVQFPGVYVAIITPFKADGEIDYPRLRDHIDYLLEGGVHGLIPTGSCGEYAALSDKERASVVEEIIKATRGRVPVVVGTAAPSTAKMLGWIEHAKEAGATGVMLLPPINYRPSRREVVEYYKAAGTGELPIIAYNNPFDTSTDLTPDLLAEIAAEVPNVVGVKEFSGDVRRIPEILEKTRLEVIAGADDLALEGILAGATGWIAGLTNISPRESVQLFEWATAGELIEATSLYHRLLPLFRWDSNPRFVQVIKYVLELDGQPVGHTRPPRMPLSEEDRRAVEAAYRHFKQSSN